MLLLYSQTITPRLKYIVDFFSKELFDDPIRLSTDKKEYLNCEFPKIIYSGEEASQTEFLITPVPLLFETNISPQKIECFELNFHKAFFQSRGDLHFDIFAASFYLLSRYEEYLPHQKDQYGRFDHINSVAVKEHFLQQPLINIWIGEFQNALQLKFPRILFKRRQFKNILSYDIDIAYSYKYKGWVRTVGGFAKAIAKRQWGLVKERFLVLRNKKKDPFDCYEWLDAIHLYCRAKPYYFFLVAKKQKGYDKNVSTQSAEFRKLLEYYAANYKVGLHPSWQSGDDPRLLKEELERMEVITEKEIIESRQHYIRFTVPATYRQLSEAGIKKEFSMGYGSVNGFRASVCSSFQWYDLEKEVPTGLMIYPFCFMDANSFYESMHSAQKAYSELIRFYEVVKKYNGLFITVWHNHILGSDPAFEGWREMFELFMKETVYWDAYYDGS